MLKQNSHIDQLLDPLVVVAMAKIDAATENIQLTRSERGNWMYPLPKTFVELYDEVIEKIPSHIMKNVDVCMLSSLSFDEQSRIGVFQEIVSGKKRSKPSIVLDCLMQNVSMNISQKLNHIHDIFAVSYQCATGLKMLEMAENMIRLHNNVVLLTAVEKSTNPFTEYLFGSLAATNCQEVHRGSFDIDRNGLTIGDGAACLVVMSKSKSIELNLTPLAEINGVTCRTSPNHITQPTSKEFIIELIEELFKKTKFKKTDICHWNAHGTGTKANDIIEYDVFSDIFLNHDIPISSYKSFVGHTLGPSALIEIIAGIEYFKSNRIFHNANLTTPLANDSRIISSTQPTNRKSFIKTSFGFGGRNAAAIVTTL